MSVPYSTPPIAKFLAALTKNKKSKMKATRVGRRWLDSLKSLNSSQS